MFDGLHLKRPATGERPSGSFKVTAIAAIWYAIYYFLLVFHCRYICVLHHFRDINTYLPNNEDVTWSWPCPSKGQFVITRQALLKPIRVQNLTILSLAISKKFKGCKILKWITWPWSRPFQGRSVVWRLTIDIAYKHTKLISLAVPKIFHGVWNSKIDHVTLSMPT